MGCCVWCCVRVQLEMSRLPLPALKSSMNELVELLVDPSLIRNSLSLTELTFRTFSTVVSDCVLPAGFVQEALPTISPLNAAEPEVTLKVALTVAPGATGSAIVPDVFVAFHCRGTVRVSLTPV